MELKSINSRYLEVNHKIPRLFSDDEDAMLSLVRKKLLRGKIILNVNYTLLNDNLNQINLNENKVNEYISIAEKLNKSKVFKEGLTIDRLLTLPEVISTRTTSSNISYKRILSKSINDAISDLIIMRTKEGENLSKDIMSRLKKIKKDLALIVKFPNVHRRKFLEL